jgi:O-antigen ligase
VRKTPINQPIAIYFVITMIATIAGFAAHRVGMYGFFFVLKYLEYFVLFYIIINQVHDEEAIKRYINVMLFTCLVAALVGIAQIPTGERVSAPFEGQVGEPNTFGGYLVLMFSVTLGMFLHSSDAKLRRRLMALTAIILVPLAFTESRSSYLALAAALGYFIVISERKRFVVISCIVGLILSPFLFPHSVIQRMTYTFEQTREAGQIAVGGVHIDTSTSARLYAWKEVLQRDFFSHPIIGVGVTGGHFMDAQYPRVLSETGIIGLIAFLWLLRRIWVLLKRCYREIEDERIKGAALGTLCGYGGLLFHAIGSNSFIIVRIMEPFMILLALMLAAMLTEKPETLENIEGFESTLQKPALVGK